MLVYHVPEDCLDFSKVKKLYLDSATAHGALRGSLKSIKITYDGVYMEIPSTEICSTYSKSFSKIVDNLRVKYESCSNFDQSELNKLVSDFNYAAKSSAGIL